MTSQRRFIHANTYLFAVTIEANKDGIKFAANGDIGNGSVTLRSHSNVDKPNQNVDIELTEPVTLTFSLKYLVNFCKAQPLSERVRISLSSEVPLLVEYLLSNDKNSGHLRFYLAPKVSHSGFTAMLVYYFADYLSRLATRSKKKEAKHCRISDEDHEIIPFGWQQGVG